MGSIPFALSIHHFINSVGADAGFASIIGLAILILLYFAQARETATLRNHAQEAAQRIQDLEARLAQLLRAQPPAGVLAQQARPGQPAQARPAQAAQPSRVVPEVAPAASRVAQGPVPIAPAGVAAPALTAATKLIPTPAPAAAPAAVAAAAPPDATVIGAEPVSAPATVAGGANGNGQDRVAAAPRPVSAAASTQTPPPRVQIRPGGQLPPSRRQPPPRSRGPQGGGPFRFGRIAAALAAVVVLAVIVVGLVLLTSNNGGGTNNSTNGNSRTTNTPTKKRSTRQAAVAPSSVTVAVLNGTPTAGLAKRIATNLGAQGYKQGTVTNAADQTHTTTTVAYLPGFRRDALAVAASLKLGQSAVAPIDQATQSVACPPPTACSANVVVTAGANLANTQ